LRANFLAAIILYRYNANISPLFNPFVARFCLAIFSFLKTDERKGVEGNREGEYDFRRVETDNLKAAREYYEQYQAMSDHERCCKYYIILFTTFFIITGVV